MYTVYYKATNRRTGRYKIFARHNITEAQARTFCYRHELYNRNTENPCIITLVDIQRAFVA